MGGYTRLLTTLTGPPRELEVFKIGSLRYIHSGSGTKLERFTLDQNDNASVISDRTPAAYTSSADNDWSFGEVYDTASGNLKIIAHAAPNILDPANNVNQPIWVGDATGVAILTAVTGSPGDDVSGGVMALQTYAVAYGSNGAVLWSVSNNPGDFAGAGSGGANVTGQKIIKGLPLRGGGQSPAALLWSLDSLLRMSFIGGSAIWQFDTLSGESSILSSNTVIEFDGIYYWCGIDRFLMFNGVLQELDNDLNLNWFFDNLTPGYAGKAFSFKIPRYGEIWFCAPMFGNTEPSHAAIFNVRESRRSGYPVWYDTVLPDDLRGAAHYAQTTRSLLQTAATPISGLSTYALWRHEDGQPDRIEGTSVLAVRSFFETNDISMMDSQRDPSDKSLSVSFMEPDFIQNGPLTVQISGRANARSEQVYGDPVIIGGTTPAPSDEQLVNFNISRRELRFRFESNVQGGDYQMGKVIAHVQPTDGRLLA